MLPRWQGLLVILVSQISELKHREIFELHSCIELVRICVYVCMCICVHGVWGWWSGARVKVSATT